MTFSNTEIDAIAAGDAFRIKVAQTGSAAAVHLYVMTVREP